MTVGASAGHRGARDPRRASGGRRRSWPPGWRPRRSSRSWPCGSASRCSPTSPTRWSRPSARAGFAQDPRGLALSAAHRRPGRAGARLAAAARPRRCRCWRSRARSTRATRTPRGGSRARSRTGARRSWRARATRPSSSAPAVVAALLGDFLDQHLGQSARLTPPRPGRAPGARPSGPLAGAGRRARHLGVEQLQRGQPACQRQALARRQLQGGRDPPRAVERARQPGSKAVLARRPQRARARARSRRCRPASRSPRRTRRARRRRARRRRRRSTRRRPPARPPPRARSPAPRGCGTAAPPAAGRVARQRRDRLHRLRGAPGAVGVDPQGRPRAHRLAHRGHPLGVVGQADLDLEAGVAVAHALRGGAGHLLRGAGGQRQVHRDRVGAERRERAAARAASGGPAPPAPTRHGPGAARRARAARRAARRSPRPRSRRRRARAAPPRRSPPCPSSSSSRITASSRAATTPPAVTNGSRSGICSRRSERLTTTGCPRTAAARTRPAGARWRPAPRSARGRRCECAHRRTAAAPAGATPAAAAPTSDRPPAAGIAMGTSVRDDQHRREQSRARPRPSRTARVRLPARRSVSMSRTLLTTRIAAASRPTGTARAKRLPRELLGLHVVGAGHGHQAEEEEHEQLAQALVAVGPRAARVEHARRDRHHADDQQLRPGDRTPGRRRPPPRSRTPRRCRSARAGAASAHRRSPARGRAGPRCPRRGGRPSSRWPGWSRSG